MELQEGTPEEAGLDAEQLLRAEAVLERGIEAAAFPGAVALVARRGVVALHAAYGRASVEDGESGELDRGTIYDLA